MPLSITHLLQILVGLGLLNVWLLRRQSATPYRGGASRTLMICALAPGHEHAHETLCTLRFAESVSKIASK